MEGKGPRELNMCVASGRKKVDTQGEGGAQPVAWGRPNPRHPENERHWHCLGNAPAASFGHRFYFVFRIATSTKQSRFSYSPDIHYKEVPWDPGTALPSVYLTSHMTGSPRPSPSMLAFCKLSKDERWEREVGTAWEPGNSNSINMVYCQLHSLWTQNAIESVPEATV